MIRTIAAALAAFVLVSFSVQAAEETKAEKKADKAETKADKKADKAEKKADKKADKAAKKADKKADKAEKAAEPAPVAK